MLEWTLGITDSSPATWRSVEPHWDDEKIVASGSNSFHDLMDKLCETSIKNRREYDHAIDEHLWNMKILSLNDAMSPRGVEERLMDMMDHEGDSSGFEDGDSDDPDDVNEKKYRGNIVIQCPGDEEQGGYEDVDDPRAQAISSKTKLSKSLLPAGYVVRVTYDYGTTTTLYLKVLSVKVRAVQSLLQYFSLEASSADMMKDMKAVPVYQLPPDKRVDSFFPHACRALLGYYVPLFTNTDGHDIGESRRVMGCVTMGLLAKIRSEEDTVFASMEDRQQSNDLLFCPHAMEPDELLEVMEKAWQPRDRSTDADGLDHFRYDWIKRWLIGADDDEAYERMSEMVRTDPGWGSKKLLFRLPRGHKPSGFNFAKAFPRTHGHLRSGMFRWFQYKKDVLRVIAGRGVGGDCRQCEGRQILRTRKHEFASFHDLLCAVEASWMWKGEELAADAVIPEFDTDLGPSRPLPKEPSCCLTQKDTIAISTCGDKKKLVTALAISEEADGKTVMYSGHDDGTLAKWVLDDNEEVWRKQIYKDFTPVQRHEQHIGISIKETPGVAGIAVRPGVIYTWTDAYDGYPEQITGPYRLSAWSDRDGRHLHDYRCNVGLEREGQNAYPSISTVVFCQVEGVDSIIVGLHCCCNTLEYEEDFSYFDIDDAREFSEGNILHFHEHDSTRRAMPSWRGHGGMIRGMAVVGTKFLVSFSICNGHGFPDSMILWSVEEAGVPLYMKWFWDPYEENRLQQQQTRLMGIDGISVSGNHILIADNHGDRIAAVIVEEDEDGDYLEFHGYANIGSRYYEDEGFHGRMASSVSKYCVVAMEIEPTAWVFPIEDCSTHGSLDRRDGHRRKFDDEFRRGNDDDECLREKRAARAIAACKIEFPKWGSNKPTRKRKSPGPIFLADTEDESVGLGKGGPVQLAMRGRHVVAGFSNGSLAKVLLPENFDTCTSSQSSNNLVSCGTLPSDEWHVPILECEDD